MSPAIIIGLDLGSARLGIFAAPSAPPLRRYASTTLPVDPADLDATVRAVLGGVAATGCAAVRVVIEHNVEGYVSPGWSPQKTQAILKAHRICSVLHHLLKSALDGARVPHETIARNTWSHRVVPHHRGGMSDAEANEGIAAHLSPEDYAALADQDQRDAAGAVLGALMGPGKRARATAKRPALTPEEREARRVAKEARLRAAALRVLRVKLPPKVREATCRRPPWWVLAGKTRAPRRGPYGKDAS